VLKRRRRVSISVSLCFSPMILISSDILILRSEWRLSMSFESKVTNCYLVSVGSSVVVC
jgi:hypothetical protein